MKLIKILFAWLLFSSVAFAQVGQIPAWPPLQRVVSGTPFGITFVSNNNSVVATSAYTFTAQNIGTADATRIVVVAISAQGGTGITVLSVTIGGVFAAQVSGAYAQASSGPATDIWQLAVPTGTSADIIVTWSTSITRMAVAVYGVIGTGVSVSTGANANSATSVSTLVQSATIPASGGAIGILNAHSSTAGAMTPTNLVSDTNVVFGNSTMQSGKNTSSSGSTSMGFSWAGTATDGALSLVTFNP